jgi:hypothetical protein
VVSSKPRPHFIPWNDLVPVLQEPGWAPGPVWTGGKSRPLPDSIPDRPTRSSVDIPTEIPDPLLRRSTYGNKDFSSVALNSFRASSSQLLGFREKRILRIHDSKLTPKTKPEGQDLFFWYLAQNLSACVALKYLGH